MAFTDYVGMQDQAIAAKNRAIAQNTYQRNLLRQQYGLGQDNAMDPNNQLGSLYQNGVNTAQNYGAAADMARSRGFNPAMGGLGGKATTAARNSGLLNQAQQVQSATLGLGNLDTQDYQANTDYQNTTNSIGRSQAGDLAAALVANPIATPVAAPGQATPTQTDPRFAAITPAQAKKNPTIYRTLRNT